MFFTITKKTGNLSIDNMLIKISKKWSNINKIINNIVASYPKGKEIKDEKYSNAFNLLFKNIIIESLESQKKKKIIKNDFKIDEKFKK